MSEPVSVRVGDEMHRYLQTMDEEISTFMKETVAEQMFGDITGICCNCGNPRYHDINFDISHESEVIPMPVEWYNPNVHDYLCKECVTNPAHPQPGHPDNPNLNENLVFEDNDTRYDFVAPMHIDPYTAYLIEDQMVSEGYPVGYLTHSDAPVVFVEYARAWAMLHAVIVEGMTDILDKSPETIVDVIQWVASIEGKIAAKLNASHQDDSSPITAEFIGGTSIDRGYVVENIFNFVQKRTDDDILTDSENEDGLLADVEDDVRVEAHKHFMEDEIMLGACATSFAPVFGVRDDKDSQFAESNVSILTHSETNAIGLGSLLFEFIDEMDDKFVLGRLQNTAEDMNNESGSDRYMKEHPLQPLTDLNMGKTPNTVSAFNPFEFATKQPNFSFVQKIVVDDIHSWIEQDIASDDDDIMEALQSETPDDGQTVSLSDVERGETVKINGRVSQVVKAGMMRICPKPNCGETVQSLGPHLDEIGCSTHGKIRHMEEYHDMDDEAEHRLEATVRVESTQSNQPVTIEINEERLTEKIAGVTRDELEEIARENMSRDEADEHLRNQLDGKEITHDCVLVDPNRNRYVLVG